MTDAERIAELEEELAALRAVLGLSGREMEQALRLQVAFDLTPGQARALVRLYSANGEPVSHDRLIHGFSPNPFDIQPQVVKVHVSNLRKRLGADTIPPIWAYGYRLAPEGMTKVRAALGEQPAEAAA